MSDQNNLLPVAATEDRDVDCIDVTGWGVLNCHAIPVEVAYKIAERINLYHAHRAAIAVSRAVWEAPNTAPKDGTMLKLLVIPERDAFTAFDDDLKPFETIGFNNLSNTGEDRWEFAGWDWSHDCFITGKGKVIGWTKFVSAVIPAEAQEGGAA